MDDYARLLQAINEACKQYRYVEEQLRTSRFLSAEFSMQKLLEAHSIDLAPIRLAEANLKNFTQILNTPILDLARTATENIARFKDAQLNFSLFRANIDAVTEKWTQSLKPIQDFEKAVGIFLQARFSKIHEISALAEARLSSLVLRGFHGKLDLWESNLRILVESLTGPYSNLYQSIEDASAIPPIVIEGPPTEFLTTIDLYRISHPIPLDQTVESIEKHIEEEINAEMKSIPDLLESVDHKLIILWRGAKEVIRSKKSDSVRHFAVSLRELLTHLIHTLAPDNQIKSWTKDPSHFHDGKPTRKARLLYISKGYNIPPFSTFVEKDIEVVIEIMNLLQAGTHRLESSLTPDQIRVLEIKMDSILQFLILVSKNS